MIQLRDVSETDLPIFFEQQLDPEATQMAAFPSRNRDGFMSHWAKIMADDSVVIKTILFNGSVAGNIVCFEQLGEREVGYWLGKEYWGKGIASRALEEFLKQIETRPLYAHVAKHNIASRRVLEKCGFTVSAEDRFFSQILGKDIEEYILVLNKNELQVQNNNFS
jgi:RimJ/RimL family protein N-acetyltransferase